MGATNIMITVRNSVEYENAKAGLIPPERVHSLELKACVDTGAMKFLVIDEELRDKLGLGVLETYPVRVVGGRVVEAQKVGPVEIRWKDRSVNCDATVVPGQAQPLFGVLSLEALDLMVDPVNNTVVGVQGDKILEIIE